MRVPGDFAYKLPERLASADAAPLLCAGITVYAPLRTHITRPGMRVAVVGIGGLGHLALQFAAALGADVSGGVGGGCRHWEVADMPARSLGIREPRGSRDRTWFERLVPR
jgi:uncharacterized zinc-type alcohol dehydrogenase-like protein